VLLASVLLVSVLLAGEAADSGWREPLQPFAIRQSARRAIATEGGLNMVELNTVSFAIRFVASSVIPDIHKLENARAGKLQGA
jgi:hypothetical protein